MRIIFLINLIILIRELFQNLILFICNLFKKIIYLQLKNIHNKIKYNQKVKIIRIIKLITLIIIKI